MTATLSHSHTLTHTRTQLHYIKLINVLAAINNSHSPPSITSRDAAAAAAAAGDGTAEDRGRSGPPLLFAGSANPYR